MTVPVTRVSTIYGGRLYVATADLAGTRPLLPLYTREGVRWSNTPAGERAIRRHQASSVHRDNIGPKQTEAQALAAVEAVFRQASAQA